MKRTVLASFTDLMLLPVTIVPRSIGAVGAIVQTGGSAAVQGISMLNPGRWIGTNVSSNVENGRQEGYTSAAEMKGALVEKGTVVFHTIDHDGDDEDDLTGTCCVLGLIWAPVLMYHKSQ
jgi:recyclin-1